MVSRRSLNDQRYFAVCESVPLPDTGVDYRYRNHPVLRNPSDQERILRRDRTDRFSLPARQVLPVLARWAGLDPVVHERCWIYFQHGLDHRVFSAQVFRQHDAGANEARARYWLPTSRDGRRATANYKALHHKEVCVHGFWRLGRHGNLHNDVCSQLLPSRQVEAAIRTGNYGAATGFKTEKEICKALDRSIAGSDSFTPAFCLINFHYWT